MCAFLYQEAHCHGQGWIVQCLNISAYGKILEMPCISSAIRKICEIVPLKHKHKQRSQLFLADPKFTLDKEISMKPGRGISEFCLDIHGSLSSSKCF